MLYDSKMMKSFSQSFVAFEPAELRPALRRALRVIS